MKHIILSSLVSVLFAFWASAQQGHGDFNTVIATVLANNPELKSYANTPEISRLEAADANSLPNPEVSFSNVWEAVGSGNKLELEVSQSFDWPGAYSARKKAAQAGVSAAQMLYLSRRLDLALLTKQKLNDLVYQNSRLELLNRIKANIDTLQARVEAGYRGGELTILDSKKMQMEQYKISTEIASVSASILRLKAEIQALCPEANLNLDGFDAYPVEPCLDADTYLAQIESLDPVIAAGNLSVEQEVMNAKAAAQQCLPGFSVGYIFQKEMGDKFNGFSLSVSLPFFQGKKSREIALSRSENARLSNQTALAARRADVIATIRDMQTSREQIEAYRQVFGDNAYLSLLLLAYRGGEINAIEYLQEVNYFISLAQDYCKNQYRYNQALTSLNRYNLLSESE